MKKIWTFSLLIGFMVTIFFNTNETAYAHTRCGSVDGDEIRWGTSGGSTGWTTWRDKAITKWNTMGAINIAPDTALTVEDLYFKDYYDSRYTTAGKHTCIIGGADEIKINDYWMSQYDVEKKENVLLHEIGHALHIDHHTLTGNIMYDAVTIKTTFGTHDISDYRGLWGY
jgi:hypothetical protein